MICCITFYMSTITVIFHYKAISKGMARLGALNEEMSTVERLLIGESMFTKYYESNVACHLVCSHRQIDSQHMQADCDSEHTEV